MRKYVPAVTAQLCEALFPSSFVCPGIAEIVDINVQKLA